MQLHYLPRFRVVTALFFQQPLALFGGVLLCLVPVAASGQSVTFTGAQTTLPISVPLPFGVAVDNAGDVFVVNPAYHQTVGGVVELPHTATGYGTQTTLPIILVSDGVAVDSTGDVFLAGFFFIGEHPFPTVGYELPKTATGYGPQVTLPTSGLNNPQGIAVDSAGDVFIADELNSRVVELPQTATGYGPQTTLPASGLLYPYGVAVDSAGDVFIADAGNSRVVELPLTATGYGPQTTLPTSGLLAPPGVAVDSSGDVFIAAYANSIVVELPKTATGYGPQVTLPFTGLSSPIAVAVDRTGDVFTTDPGNDRVLDLQTRSVNFEGVYVCTPEQTTPAPCNETLTLNYNVNADVTLGTPKVLTGGAPDLDFTLASGSTCTGPVTAGETCVVNVTFAPLAGGRRNGAVEITDGSGNVLTTTEIYGFGQVPPTIDFSQGFGQAPGELQSNGSASLAGTALELTNGGLNEASSVFYPSPVNVQSFTTDFTFQLTNPAADGFTLTIQNVGPGALGGHGGSLGYEGIGKSVAVKFDLYQNPGDPSNDSTGIFVDGALPTGPTSIDLTGSGINLHSGDTMDAHLTYDGTTLNLTLTDTVIWKSWSHPFPINIPATVGGDTAYVGFTAATGADTSTLQILSWSYQAGQPLYYPAGFSSESSLSMNGSASLSGTAIQLTSHGSENQAGSAFYTTPVNIQAFTTNFNFQLTNPAADGFTFTIQNVGPGALGGRGGSLGYEHIGNSVAIKFDLYQNTGDPSNNSTGVFIDGVGPFGGIDLTGSGINLHSGDAMDGHITYNGTTLTLTITDLVTMATWSHPFTIDIPGTMGGSTAYVGFTGATGAGTSTQQILNWTFE